MLDQVIDERSGEGGKDIASSCCSSSQAGVEPVAKSGITTVLKQYQPIIAIALSALLGSVVMPVGHHDVSHVAHMCSVFMGLFLFPLALLKLFDIEGFAAAFNRYDLAAQYLPGYALAYPFLEMALSLGFLSGLWPTFTHIAALIIGGVGTVGIIRTLSKGQQVKCACVGSTLNVPLGSVSIAENAGMAAMAVFLLVS